MRQIWQNGHFIEWDKAQTHVLSHSLHYGSGVFEGIRVYETDNGPNIFKLDAHLQRLFYSAECMGMSIPYSQSEFSEAIVETVHVNALKSGYIRPLIYYGHGNALQVSPRAQLPIECVIACWESSNYLPVERVDVKTSPTVKIPANAGILNAKICGQYANSLLAGLCIRGTHYHEVLLLDQDGFVAEGAAQNIFIVKNNTLYTPRPDNILPGITRELVIELAERLSIKCFQTNLTLNDVLQADEAFFTGSAAEITAIRSLDDVLIGRGEKGVVTESIQRHYQALTHGQLQHSCSETLG